MIIDNNIKNIVVIESGLEELDYVSELFDKYRVFYGQKSNIQESKRFIKQRMINKESVIFLALGVKGDTKVTLGLIQMYPSFSSVSIDKIWILNDLYVDDISRRQGVGQLLMNKAKEFAIESGAIRITLDTQTGNTTAQRLYGLMGYIKNEEFYNYNLVLK